MIYLIIFFFLLLCTLLFEGGIDKRLSSFLYLIQYLVLVLFMTFRFRVGGDGLFYQNAFRYMPTLETITMADLNGNQNEYQPFWFILNAAVKSIYDDFTFFQFVHALIINTAFFVLINRYCKRRFLGVLVYYIFFYLYFNTEILRESLAVVLFIFAYPLIFKKKYFQYYLLCTCAYLFHAFAMVTFLVPLVVYFLKKPINLRKGFIIFLVLLVLPTILLNGILKVFTFNEYVERQFKYYIELEINANGILKNLFDAIPVFMVLAIQLKKKRLDPIFIPAINLYLIMVLLSITIAGATRLSNYFVFFFFIGLINTFVNESIYKIPKFRMRLLIIVFFLLVSKSFYYMRDMSKYNHRKDARFYNIYLPYHSVFDPITDPRRENIFRNSMQENVK